MAGLQVALSVLDDAFAICRFAPTAPLPAWALGAGFVALTRTPAELSIVCPEALVPAETVCARGWRCLAVEGPLDFALTGIVASLTAPLAQADISVFVVSTFDTDYLFMREPNFARGCAALAAAGFVIRSATSG